MATQPTPGTTPVTAPLEIGYVDVRSDDGTRLRAWTNDPDGTIEGPTVLLCNGLGTGPWAWPALFEPDCGVRVVSWHHRGVGGSARPTDRARVGVTEFVEDGLSVMDHFGVERTVLVGWSMGVNTAFELAVHHPERVSGILAVAGVPGGTFATMLGPLRVPRLVAHLAAVNASRVLKHTGRLLSPVVNRVPVTPLTMGALTHSGFMLPVPDPALAARAVREFLATPVDWYFHLALGTSQHARVSLSNVHVPATFVAASYDVLAGAHDMRTAAARMADADYVELRASHFVQMERPDAVHRLLLELLERVS
ncbi:alpha/beta hydrolase [Nocardioides sp. Soil777]|uniref:alpha/beta fold hydrolase n=1 Tax=Nocardioides sp. Soil777 TaxID=1736409 RepID=UPI0007039CCB|nr:alpha/beta hydrolase [Nocardioides sp. Soil777]KRF07614.1 alpha/beta hydrolase [Nocardioides sp. Soil777]